MPVIRQRAIATQSQSSGRAAFTAALSQASKNIARKWLKKLNKLLDKTNKLIRLATKPGEIFKLVKLKSKHLVVGRRGEAAAIKLLLKTGHYIWHTNWRCALGEIDIIAVKNRTLIFVEVKTRRKVEGAMIWKPRNAVDTAKQARIKRIAKHFVRANLKSISRKRIRHYRFDIITVLRHQHRSLFRQQYQPKHIEDAF
ncbi:MAG: YraN family protein [Deltaproteobacteria bacterium]|nr:YraN family protein [Deltaproteobacteria bacterium]